VVPEDPVRAAVPVRPARVLTYSNGTIIQVWPDCVRTILPDGSEVVAAPQDNDAYRATAERLGYGADTLRMSQEHELLHSWLAAHLGLPESPTLGRVARGEGDTALTGLDEDAVMAIQRFANAAGVNLLEHLSSW
jgi:hypothetical protein